MAAATGVITVAPGQVRTSPEVLFATGALFFVFGVLLFVQPHKAQHLQLWSLLCALLATSAAALVVFVTIASHDERLAIGPFVFSGPAVDTFGKAFLGADALLLWGVAAWCWRAWWRQRVTPAPATDMPGTSR